MNSTSKPDQKKTVVLIDDDVSVLSALKLVLTVLGYTVHEYANPLEAVAYITASSNCDVVLCDLRMPELDGIGVLKRVKDFRPDLPFILISGHATKDDVARANALGAVEFLGKPFTPDQLRSAIESAK